VKVFGCVDVHSAEFEYMIDEVFNSTTYMVFLETTVAQFFENNRRIHYIQDGASYHKDGDVWYWFRENRKWIEVYNLPAYSPEFNATETLWKYTRKEGTHNKNFESRTEVENTLHDVFGKIKASPQNIIGYMQPFL
jgi:transposase